MPVRGSYTPLETARIVEAARRALKRPTKALQWAQKLQTAANVSISESSTCFGGLVPGERLACTLTPSGSRRRLVGTVWPLGGRNKRNWGF